MLWFPVLKFEAIHECAKRKCGIDVFDRQDSMRSGLQLRLLKVCQFRCKAVRIAVDVITTKKLPSPVATASIFHRKHFLIHGVSASHSRHSWHQQKLVLFRFGHGSPALKSLILNTFSPDAGHVDRHPSDS